MGNGAFTIRGLEMKAYIHDTYDTTHYDRPLSHIATTITTITTKEHAEETHRTHSIKNKENITLPNSDSLWTKKNAL